MKVLRSDNGGEFVNAHMAQWCRENRVTRELSMPGTPQQNGAAERANRTVQEAVRTMLIASNVAPRFWGEAANAFV